MLIALGWAGDSLAVTAKIAADNASQAELKATFLEQIKAPANHDATSQLGLAYWIELNRHGHVYRTSDRARFQSGDQIRFHLLPSVDAYTYTVMHQGSSGSKSVLFPPSADNHDNFVKGGAECVVPASGSLEFDQTPGVEQVGLIVSRNQIDAVNYVERAGAKGAHLDRQRPATSPDQATSDLEKAYDAVFAGGGGNPGALEVLPVESGAVAPEKTERVLSSPSTAVVFGDDAEAVTVDFGLSHN